MEITDYQLQMQIIVGKKTKNETDGFKSGTECGNRWREKRSGTKRSLQTFGVINTK